ncbi:MAG: T9SS type A sorting domain-containing protein, partial [Candidatus Cloacimonetes bacterium]|nr:T9SS type A sorting domain-containing protein [Candidatus Cloacimonadota bacterium]
MKLKATSGLLLVLIVGILIADPRVWSGDDGTMNGIPIRNGENIDWTRTAATLNNGNVVYVWTDTRQGDRDIWAQCVNTSGNNLWNNGESVCVDSIVNRQENPVCINSTDGGVIIAWVDFTDSDNSDIYAQKLDENGTLLWGDGGVPLCVADDVQNSLNIVQDENGGAYIIWSDSRNADCSDIYGMHVDANGTNLWATDGLPVADGPGAQIGHVMRKDGQDGAILCWINSNNGRDIMARRIISDGSNPWGSALVLCDAPCDQKNITLIQNDTDKFAIAWRDLRTENNGDIYAQIIDINGNLHWASDPQGKVVYAGPGIQENPRVSSDGNGDFFVVWQDDRYVTQYRDIYIQKMTMAGTIAPSWPADGVVVCDEIYNQQNSRIVHDDNGGCYIVWDDGRNGGYPNDDIYIQQVNSTGNPVLEANGRILTDRDNRQFYAQILRSGANNLFVCWGDMLDGSPGLYYKALDMSATPLTGFGMYGNEIFQGLSGDCSSFVTCASGSDTYIVWCDERYGYSGTRIVAQLLHSDGTFGFAENGIPLTVDVGEIQDSPQVVLDDNDGIVCVWEQLESGYPKIVAQAMDGNGNKLWGDTGLRVSDNDRDQGKTKITKVEENNGTYYYIAWSNLVASGFVWVNKIFAQKIDEAGNLQWGDSGMIVAEYSGSSYEDLYIESMIDQYIVYRSYEDLFFRKINEDGSAGVELVLCDAVEVQRNAKAVRYEGTDQIMIIWEDRRHGPTGIFGQMVDVSTDTPTIVWEENGRAIASDTYDFYKAELSNEDDNFYLVWADFAQAGDENIAMQKLDADGNSLWNPAVYVVEEDSRQTDPDFITVNHNIFAVWTDFNEISDYNYDADLYGNFLGPDGGFTYTPDNGGFPISTAIRSQGRSQISYIGENDSGNSEAVVVWLDTRSSGDEKFGTIYSIYAQKIVNEYTVNNEDSLLPEAVISLKHNYPNPFNPETTIAFSLEKARNVELTVYNVKGQAVKTLVKDDLADGDYSIVFKGENNSGQSIASGVYFYRLKSDEFR